MEQEYGMICPRCGKYYSDYPAMSRRDHRTDICPDCGINEAFFDLTCRFIEKAGSEKEKKALRYIKESERAWLNYLLVGS